MLKKWIGIFVIIAIIGGGLYWYAGQQSSKKVKAELDQFITEFESTGQGKLSYDDACVGLLGQKIYVHNVLFEPSDSTEATVAIETLTVSKLDLTSDEEKLPDEVHLDINNAVVTINDFDSYLGDAKPLEADILRSIMTVSDNTAELSYDAEVGYALNNKTKVLDIYTNYDIPKLLTANFSVNLGQMPDFSSLDLTDDSATLDAFSKATLKQLNIRFDDAGVMKKIYQAGIKDPSTVQLLQAQGKEANVENLKQMILAELDTQAQNPMAADNPLMQTILEQSRQFITNDSPQLDVSIKTKQDEGLSFDDLLMLALMGAHPDAVNELLDIDIQVK